MSDTADFDARRAPNVIKYSDIKPQGIRAQTIQT